MTNPPRENLMDQIEPVQFKKIVMVAAGGQVLQATPCCSQVTSTSANPVGEELHKTLGQANPDLRGRETVSWSH